MTPAKKTILTECRILLGVSAGIAAYKSVDLARKLTVSGAEVSTVMTENACRMVGPKTFEAVTKGPLFTEMWDIGKQYRISHVNLLDWADMIVVAPTTANTLAKIANGICNDLLSTVVCACWNKPVLLAPSMNNNMWENPAVQQNIHKVKEMGIHLIGPEKGILASGVKAMGRMSEPKDVIERLERMASTVKRKS